MTDLSAISNALITCDTDTVIKLVKEAVDQGIEANDILKIGLIQGMAIGGEKMDNKDNLLRCSRFSEGNFEKGDTLLE